MGQRRTPFYRCVASRLPELFRSQCFPRDSLLACREAVLPIESSPTVSVKIPSNQIRSCVGHRTNISRNTRLDDPLTLWSRRLPVPQNVVCCCCEVRTTKIARPFPREVV